MIKGPTQVLEFELSISSPLTDFMEVRTLEFKYVFSQFSEVF